MIRGCSWNANDWHSCRQGNANASRRGWDAAAHHRRGVQGAIDSGELIETIVADPGNHPVAGGSDVCNGCMGQPDTMRRWRDGE